MKVRLNVSAGRYEALKTQLEAQGIEVDEAADLVLSEERQFWDTVMVRRGEERIFLPAGEIVYMEAQGRMVEVHTKDGVYQSGERLYRLAAGLDPEVGLMYRDISQFKDTEIPKAIAMIQAVAQQINAELSAKRRNTGRTGKLDFRRTIRKGLETGGSFYRLKYKRKHHRRKKLVLLCDVSGSMMQFSEFALRFIQSLNQVSENSQVFLFSEELFEADAFSLQNMDLFRNYVRESGLYGKGTDLGAALKKLCAMKPSVLGPSTTLIILSDTKTVDLNGATLALLEAKRQSGKVLWLNPIPESKWPYLRSTQTMATICQMVPCSTLRDLANACRRLVM